MSREDSVQVVMGGSARDIGYWRASRREIWGCIPDIVLSITAGETATVFTFSWGRLEMIVFVLAGVVGLVLVLLRVLFLPSTEQLNQRL